MATAILNPAIDSISGTIGGIVLYERCGRTIMRSYIIPPNPRTPAQQANRSRFRDAMASWRQLPDYEKDSYNRRATKLSMTGHNLYISRYMKGTVNDTEQIEAAGKSLTPGRDDEVSLTCSSHNPVRRQADTESFPSPPGMPGTCSPSLHSLYRSVTAPSAPAHRVFAHPTADLLVPGQDRETIRLYFFNESLHAGPPSGCR